MLVIIPCGGKKGLVPVIASEMYTGGYFKAGLEYALSLTHGDRDRVLILSALYGLLGLDDDISPYNVRMGDVGCVDWRHVERQAEARGVREAANVIALGGKDYTNVVKKVWPDCKTPLQGVGAIGKQLAWFKKNTTKRN